MADILAFVRHMETRLSEQAWFSTDGFTKATIHRQNLPANPIYPCIVLGYETEKTEVFADIIEGKLYVTVYTKEYPTAEQIAQKVRLALHTYTYGDTALVVYQCHNVGGPLQPGFVNSLGAWETPVEFDIRTG